MPAQLNYFNYIAFSPKEELSLAFKKTHSQRLNEFCSWKGRAICILRIFTHATGIILKPLYYLAITILSKLGNCLLKKIPLKDFKDRQDKLELAVLVRNPELVQRNQRHLVCIPTAALSEAVQLGKAILGVLHPGIYFKNDELLPYIKELAETAKNVGCSTELINSLYDGSFTVHQSLNQFPNRTYYYAQFKKDLAFICEKFRNPEFPKEQKYFLLMMLEPKPKKSGIEGCPAALGRTLQQICANINVPAKPEQVIPWLINQFKSELLKSMIVQSTLTIGDENCPQWHKIIHQMGFDPAHKNNALIAALGSKINLPDNIIYRAKQDPVIVKKPMSQGKLDELLNAFHSLYTEESLIKYLIAQINSQPDGSPGLKTFRNEATRILSEKISKDNPEIDDPAIEAIKKFYIHGGKGSPLDENFSDLNDEGIKKVAECLGNTLLIR